MPRRKFTDEELDAIANKDWKEQDNVTFNESYIKQTKNLSGPKTFEGKKRALSNLKVGSRIKTRFDGDADHEEYIRSILGETEKEFYDKRKAQYLKEFDFNTSSDELLLSQLCMDEVYYFTILKKKYEKPSADISKELNDCFNRIIKLQEQLGINRKLRQEKEEGQATVSVASLASQLSKKKAQIQIMQEQLEAEEQAFMDAKKQRDAERTVDAEYTVYSDDFDDDEEAADDE